jgi:hypothetical protein
MNEYKGVWYIPENPEVKFGGTLKISENNTIELEIITQNLGVRPIDFSPHILLGDTLDSKKFTLLGYKKLNGKYTEEGLTHFKIKFN